jgi:hypothetical protein
MKTAFLLLTAILTLQACNNEGESGVVNDGIQPVDPNGALIDSTPNKPWDPSIDTTKGDHRVDLQQRDSPEIKP